jgi:protein-L-isoaspartate(D-aspartate) O-methyltransferase
MFALPPPEAASRQQPIQEDVPFQRTSWVAERLSWVGIAFIVLAAVGGAFGKSGLLFSERETAGDGVAVMYDPIVRRQAATEIRIDTASPRVKFSPAFDDYLDITSITPPPSGVERDDGTTYVFTPLLPAGRQHIILAYKPKTAGWFDGDIAAGSGAAARFRQFVYP